MAVASLRSRCLWARVLVSLVAALLVATACNNGYSSASIADGDAVCGQLVQYCAGPAAAFGEPYQSCYDTGMRGDPDACLRAEERCVQTCYDQNAALPPPGAAGSNGGENGEAGGGDEGGAGNRAGAAGETAVAPGGAGGVSGL